jgi:DNA invertase Pin-like site-specific DNA recombinase
MENQKYIAYYRVSTQKQGISGLGLTDQQNKVRQFTKNCDACIIAEYIETESGKKDNRPQLIKAIEHAKQSNSKLIIAKLDRLSRNAAFILTLQNSKVKFVCADMPEANELTIGFMSILADYEGKKISERTKSALAVLKQKNGTIHYKTGTKNNLTPEAIEKSVLTRKEKAENNQNILKAKQYIQLLKEKNFTLRQIADTLNERNFVTSKGKNFTAMQVKRILEKD